ncbi:telomerase RNA component interacting RNase-like isoform X1 [Scleropages formosus]|uniref:telomerase RNA component interacting RNase-like isoform X1 n=1 Tax=Scleropages formosus TaxID=113540 RepID=UPI0008789F7A|nr:telomerase RNA component interacting RNase isoform X1 [Scleropages formosus]
MESKRGSKDIVVENDSDSSSDSRPNSPETSGGNAFANDGSFLELFKRKMEEEERRRRKEQQQQQEEKNKMKEGRGDTRCPQGPQSSGQKKTFSVTSFVGRRRGGAKLALKTGVVAKKRKLDSEVSRHISFVYHASHPYCFSHTFLQGSLQLLRADLPVYAAG